MDVPNRMSRRIFDNLVRVYKSCQKWSEEKSKKTVTCQCRKCQNACLLDNIEKIRGHLIYKMMGLLIGIVVDYSMMNY